MPREIFFFKNYAEDEAGKLVPDHLLFFEKAFILGKREWSAALFHHISIAL